MTMLTCLCWLGNLILKKYRKAKLMRYHEFNLKRNLESLQRAERQDLQGFESIPMEEEEI